MITILHTKKTEKFQEFFLVFEALREVETLKFELKRCIVVQWPGSFFAKELYVSRNGPTMPPPEIHTNSRNLTETTSETEPTTKTPTKH